MKCRQLGGGIAVDRADPCAVRRANDGPIRSWQHETRDIGQRTAARERVDEIQKGLLPFSHHANIHGTLQERDLGQRGHVLAPEDQGRVGTVLLQRPEEFSGRGPGATEHQSHADDVRVGRHSRHDLRVRQSVEMMLAERTVSPKSLAHGVDHADMVSGGFETAAQVGEAERWHGDG